LAEKLVKLGGEEPCEKTGCDGTTEAVYVMTYEESSEGEKGRLCDSGFYRRCRECHQLSQLTVDERETARAAYLQMPNPEWEPGEPSRNLAWYLD
jgi:hypothetical protein